jgi:hypothetical protein
MSNNALAIGGSGDPLGSDSPRASKSADGKKPRRVAPDPPPKPNSGHRLVIQQDPETEEWIYTVTDRDTGEVIARIAREEVASLGLKPDYAAGALIKAKA